MADRLADMINGFSRDQSSHYRAQLQAIQVDMTLILRADPYDIGPRDDSPDTLDQLIDTVTAGTAPIAPEARDGYLAMAGKQYHQYCLQINSAQEQRDADLTALKACLRLSVYGLNADCFLRIVTTVRVRICSEIPSTKRC